MPFQRSPSPTPSASGRPSALARFQRRREQDDERPPQSVANPTALMGNERPFAVFEEVRRGPLNRNHDHGRFSHDTM